MDISGALLIAARFGLAFTVRPAVAGNNLELKVSGLRLGALPLPAKWLLRLVEGTIPAGTGTSVDAERGIVSLDLGPLLPAGLRVETIEVTDGAVSVKVVGSH